MKKKKKYTSSKKKKNPLLFITVLGVTILFSFGFLYKDVIGYYFRLFIYTNLSESNYPIDDSFLVPIPANYVVHGIDVSAHQKKIDWKLVKSMKSDKDSISFAFIKATEGITLKDKCFIYNWQEAKTNQLIRGAYHFFLPDISPKEQAENFIQTVRLCSGDLPPVLDIEKRGIKPQKQFANNLIEFLKILESKYHVKPIIYTNLSFYRSYLDNYMFAKYPFWIAHYYVPELKTNCKWHFWQHNDHANINGISTFVDINVYQGSISELKQLTIQNTENIN